MENEYISKQVLLNKLNEMEENYRAEISERDCMTEYPFSDGVLSTMFSVIQLIKQM